MTQQGVCRTRVPASGHAPGPAQNNIFGFGPPQYTSFLPIQQFYAAKLHLRDIKAPGPLCRRLQPTSCAPLYGLVGPSTKFTLLSLPAQTKTHNYTLPVLSNFRPNPPPSFPPPFPPSPPSLFSHCPVGQSKSLQFHQRRSFPPFRSCIFTPSSPPHFPRVILLTAFFTTSTVLPYPYPTTLLANAWCRPGTASTPVISPNSSHGHGFAAPTSWSRPPSSPAQSLGVTSVSHFSSLTAPSSHFPPPFPEPPLLEPIAAAAASSLSPPVSLRRPARPPTRMLHNFCKDSDSRHVRDFYMARLYRTGNADMNPVYGACPEMAVDEHGQAFGTMPRGRPRGEDGRFVPRADEEPPVDNRDRKVCGWCRTTTTSQWRVGPTNGSPSTYRYPAFLKLPFRRFRFGGVMPTRSEIRPAVIAFANLVYISSFFPTGMGTLCNACGINYRRALAKSPGGVLNLDRLSEQMGHTRLSIQKALKRQRKLSAAPQFKRSRSVTRPTDRFAPRTTDRFGIPTRLPLNNAHSTLNMLLADDPAAQRRNMVMGATNALDSPVFPVPRAGTAARYLGVPPVPGLEYPAAVQHAAHGVVEQNAGQGREDDQSSRLPPFQAFIGDLERRTPM